MAATGVTWAWELGLCEQGLRSDPPYLSGELSSGAEGSSSGRCSPSGSRPGAGPLLPLLQLPPSMPVGGAAVRALVLKPRRRRRWRVGELLRMRLR